jgi:lipase
MSKSSYKSIVYKVPVFGGELCVSSTGVGDKSVMAIHGLAGSRASMEQIANHLDLEQYRLLAVDLRGRGASSKLPPPFGMEAHARDCAAVLEYFGASNVVLVGHSMGTLVSQYLAKLKPDVISGLVLIDGGLPTPLDIPREHLTDTYIDKIVGPVLKNIAQEFPSEEEFLAQWRAHPGWAGLWSEDVERRFRYDMSGTPPRIRSRASVDAIRDDIIEALTTDIADASAVLEVIQCPIHLVRAARGLLDQPEPTIPDERAAHWTDRLKNLTDTFVKDTNHVNVALLESGLRVIAEKVRSIN